jgi:hypothetical protein
MARSETGTIDMMAVSQDVAPPEVLPDSILESAVARNSATFDQYVEAYYFGRPAFNSDPKSCGRYRRLVVPVFEAMQAREGPVTKSYFAETLIAAAALTDKPRRLHQGERSPWWSRLRRKPKTEPTLHINYNVVDVPRDEETLRLANMVYRCKELSIKANELLDGTASAICLDMLFTLVTDVFARLERRKGEPEWRRLWRKLGHAGRAIVRLKAGRHPGSLADPEDLSQLWEIEFKRIADFYIRSATRGATSSYLQGMLLGLIGVGVCGVGAGLLLLHFPLGGLPLRPLAGSFVGGALGAMVSVMSRITRNRPDLNFEAGASTLLKRGILRPFIGTVFGLFVYFVLASTFFRVEIPRNTLGQFYLFSAVGFLAGFSERFAQDVLTRTEQGLGKQMTTVSGEGGSARQRGL